MRPLRKRIRDERDLSTHLYVSGCTTLYGSVCICQIDAAISDAAKPIGWPLWVRASYYLHVGRRAPYEGTNSTRAPRVHKRVTSSAPSCREIRIAASHKSREIGAEIRIPRSPSSPEESGQKSELPVYCLHRSPAGITLTNLSSKSPHVFLTRTLSLLHFHLIHGWDPLAALSNVKV